MLGVRTTHAAKKTSLSQDGEDRKARVFISYAREDLDVAESIRDALIEAGFDAYLDKHDIAPGEPWKERIGELIAMAEKVVFLISPDSVASEIATWEVDQAEAQAKGIIPVVARDTGSDAIPGRLKRLDYIFCRNGDDRPIAVKSLIDALSTDLAWERKKTRINDRAIAWVRSGKRTGLMTAREDIESAEAWRDTRPETSLPPTEIQLTYIAASRARHTRVQRGLIGSLFVGLVLFAGLSALFFDQRNEAQTQTLRARTNESAALTALSSVALNNGDSVAGAKLALAAWPRSSGEGWEPPTRTITAIGESVAALSERARFNQQEGSILSVVFSPDGTRIATGGYDGTARLWHARTGAEIARFEGHLDSVGSVAFSAEGTRLATGSDDGTARIWDIAMAIEVGRLEVNGGTVRVHSVAFSPDGTRLATGSSDGKARIWDIQAGVEIAPLTGHSDLVLSVGFSPNGRRLATGAADNTVRVFDVGSGAEIAKFDAHEDQVENLAFSDDGDRLFSGSVDGTVRLWDIAEKTQLAQLNGLGDYESNWVRSVAFSPNRTHVAIGRDQGRVSIFDMATGAEIAEFLINGGSFWSGTVTSIAFSADGIRLAAATNDNEGTAVVWDLSTKTAIARFDGHGGSTFSVAFSPDGKSLATGNFDGTVRLWDVQKQSETKWLEAHAGKALRVAFSPDGKRLSTLGDDYIARVWEFGEGAGGTWDEELSIELPVAVSMNISSDGLFAGIGGFDGSAQIWDISSGKMIAHFNGHTDIVTNIVLSDDNELLATSSDDTTVIVWEVVTGLPVVRIDLLEERTGSLALSPDNTLLAIGSSNGTARLWDLSKDIELVRFFGHEHSVDSVVFSPDGRHVATSSGDGTVRLWDLATGAQVAKLNLEGESALDLVFSPDNKQLASASNIGITQVWNVISSPDQRFLGFGVPNGNVFQIACEWLPRVNGQPDYFLKDIADAYGIAIDEPICNYASGYDPPLPEMGGSKR